MLEARIGRTFVLSFSCPLLPPTPTQCDKHQMKFLSYVYFKDISFFLINFFSQSSEVLKGLQRNESANKSNFDKLFSVYIYISVR